VQNSRISHHAKTLQKSYLLRDTGVPANNGLPFVRRVASRALDSRLTVWQNPGMSRRKPNPDTLPTITTSDELLAALRSDPVRRAVAIIDRPYNDELYDIAVEDITVVEGDLPDASDSTKRFTFSTKRIAWVAKSSAAHGLLEAAHTADIKCDLAAWSALPLRPHRNGPYSPMWVLPEHPQAATEPGWVE
jgi:hypothetical protein